MAKIEIQEDFMDDTRIQAGTLMAHNDPPLMVVYVTGELTSDGSFPGICLNDNVYLDSWAVEQFKYFHGKITLSQ